MRWTRPSWTTRARVPLATVALVAVLLGPLGAPAARADAPWASVAAPAGSTSLTLSGVVCRLTTCVAVGYPCTVAGCAGFNAGQIIFSADDGATWLAASVPTNVGNLSGVTCANPADCMALGVTGPPLAPLATLLVSIDFGAKWIQSPVPAAHLTSVVCVAYTQCLAVGSTKAGKAKLLRSSVFGARWAVVTLPTAMTALSAVTCSSVTDCVALGGTRRGVTSLSAVSADGGRTWRLGHVPANIGTVAAISCMNWARCVLAGTSATERVGVVAWTSNAGLTWGLLTPMTGTSSMSGVSCYAATCVAVGAASSPSVAPMVFSTASQGKHWLNEPVPVGESNLAAGVSCESPGTCVAAGETFTTAGATPTPDGPYLLRN